MCACVCVCVRACVCVCVCVRAKSVRNLAGFKHNTNMHNVFKSDFLAFEKATVFLKSAALALVVKLPHLAMAVDSRP